LSDEELHQLDLLASKATGETASEPVAARPYRHFAAEDLAVFLDRLEREGVWTDDDVAQVGAGMQSLLPLSMGTMAGLFLKLYGPPPNRPAETAPTAVVRDEASSAGADVPPPAMPITPTEPGIVQRGHIRQFEAKIVQLHPHPTPESEATREARRLRAEREEIERS